MLGILKLGFEEMHCWMSAIKFLNDLIKHAKGCSQSFTNNHDFLKSRRHLVRGAYIFFLAGNGMLICFIVTTPSITSTQSLGLGTYRVN